ncbi:MAG: hypothetical protein JWM90_662 [Thermoleophilia bacterium]|nr:hypothetical protein [Thermoleophilia bacterium]
MTTVSQISTFTPYTTRNGEPIPRPGRDAKRRSHAHAGQGAALLAATQTLPFAVGGSLRVSNGLLFPIAGAALGALLLGAPGVFLGGIAGWLFARR